MPAFEIEAKNLAKAIKKACAQLNVSEGELRYDILSRGSSGIFGLAGAKKARILVHAAEQEPRREVPGNPTAVLDPADPANQSFPVREGSPESTVSKGPLQTDFPAEAVDLGQAVLRRIVDAISDDAKINVKADAERIQYNVAGGNPAILIGKKGQTLEAIQTLVDKIVNRSNNNHNRIRVRVDVEGYLETRKRNLERLAERMAEKSRRIGKPVSLGQMNAYDRRTVHMALKDHPDVRTQSRGEGPTRKLVIFPRKSKNRRSGQQLN